jgi:DNA-binding GntR family transcriptional regulator
VLAKANKADQAYDVLEAMITFQELPPGAMLSESILMERTELGRTPIREALQRLARERLVEIHPSRGVFVAPISVEAQLKLLEVRRTVEELAVRLATHRADEHQKEAMLRLAADLEDATDLKEFGRLLKRTHQVIVTAAHNDYLLVAMAPLQALSRRFWFANLKDPARELRTAAKLHGDNLRAICSADDDKAATASLRLSDYLVEFAYQALHAPERALRR